jgi:hypothetical protein
MRNQADYDLDRFRSHAYCSAQFEAAAKVLRLLDELRGTPSVLARVIEAIRVYERAVPRQVTWRA